MTLPVKTHQMICRGMIDLNASNHRKRLGKKKEYLVISAHEMYFQTSNSRRYKYSFEIYSKHSPQHSSFFRTEGETRE